MHEDVGAFAAPNPAVKGLALNELMIDRTLCGQRRVQGIALVGVQG